MRTMRTATALGTALVFLGLLFVLPASAASGEKLLGPALEDQKGSDQVGPVGESKYIIGPEDVLEVLVKDSAELSRQVVVRADGKITLPILGDIDVQGHTPQEMEELIREKAAQFLREPIFITVIVTASRNARVYLMGGAVAGNIVPLTRPMTLLPLLAQTNLSEAADLTNAFVLRAGERLPIDFAALVKRGDLSHNVRMEPDDVVFVPLTDPFIGRIKVVGQVGSPTIIPYREGLTVLDAILMVGGPTPFANQNGTKIIRVNGAGEKREVRVKLKNLLNGDLSKNVILEPNDTIVVPQAWF